MPSTNEWNADQVRNTIRTTPADALQGAVEALTGGLHGQQVALERRGSQRTPLPLLLRLVPLDPDGNPVEEEATVVVGKDISQGGIGFFHEQPLVWRRAYVYVDQPEVGRICFEADLTWCRFTQSGWYESGGRLVALHQYQPVESSLAS